MTRRDFIWKWTAYALVLAATALVNYHILTFLPLNGVPVLPLVAAVAVGVLEGPAAGAGYGIAAGAVLSAATHGTVWWTFFLSLAGWLCGLLVQYVFRRDMVGFFPSCLATALVYEGSRLLPHLLGGDADPGAVLRVAGLELLWTMVFAFPIYALCLFCCRHYGRIYHE